MLNILAEVVIYTADPGTAIFFAALISAGTAAVVSEEQRKSASKAASKQRKLAASLAEQNKDKRVITPRDVSKRNARAALVVGSPRGVLSIEDQTATSGRGTLLGN